MAKAVVPTKWFTDNAISPSRHDFVIKNEIRYKVVGIEQYDEGQRMNVYYLMLKREELAA